MIRLNDGRSGLKARLVIVVMADHLNMITHREHAQAKVSAIRELVNTL